MALNFIINFLKKNLNNNKKYLPVLLVLIFAIFHTFLASKTFSIDDNGNIRTAFAAFGDIPLHMTQVTKFGLNDLDDLNEPIYAGSKLKYPFIINFFSGFLLRITGNLTFAMLVPVFVLIILNVFIVYLIYKKFTGGRWLALFALLFFFLGSGLGAWSHLQHAFDNSMSLSEFNNYLLSNNIATAVKNDAVYPEQNIGFGAPLSMSFLHQRTFLLGLFGFLLFFLLINVKTDDLKKKQRWIWAGIVLGALPMAHAHSFIATGIVLGLSLFVALINKNWQRFKFLFAIAMIAFVIALPQVWYLIGDNDSFGEDSGFMHLRVGWMTEPSTGSIRYPEGIEPTIWHTAFLKFLWVNFGVILPAFFVAAVYVFWPRQINSVYGIKKMRYFALFGLMLFLVVQFIKFQPWDYDNNKLLVYWQFFTAGLLMMLLGRIYEKKKILGVVLTSVFLVAVLGSGVVDMIPRAMANGESLYVIFNLDARKMAEYIHLNIPESEIILTGTAHLNPVNSLAGREVWVGYPGWLWTRGINYSDRIRDVKNFYTDPISGKYFVEKENINYALFDNSVVYDFNANKEIFDQNFRKVFESGSYTLYEL
ncbi:MAG: hypothetical protein COV29_01155 [Candidatus Yanofskybacteria bacterium CG10_big_fil_rev_8_21_14_0_10_36_16]|uniref:Uncharacterized protein n=1 Tax=Candidatus Yanofskybacteria bacterium CG10_big_fil_rev_8_21_14_0_10_36_16 TaxID=1975096 RepID=A0A2J0Q863_9BACT|nr:MAG: hypothetical protein COV29_01155 [Candidatus Yanofskybacteria bacterium CG10_big_fil_rev_8_21_14_0_10_36_16]